MAQTHVERAQEMVRELLTTGQDVLAHVRKEDLADVVRHLKGSEERVPRVNSIVHWATVLDCIEYGLESDPQKVRASAQLLLGKLEEERQETIVKHLKRVLEGRKGKLISPAGEKTKGADDEY